MTVSRELVVTVILCIKIKIRKLCVVVVEKKEWVFPLVMSIILIAFDQYTKFLAVTSLKPLGSIVFIEGFMDFTFVENRGIAFGMLSGKRWIILLTTIIISAVIIWNYFNLPEVKEYKSIKYAMILVFSGAIGNIIDRLFRGYVVDFFEFTFFNYPVFNVADCFVVVGAIVLSFMVLFVIKDDDEKENSKEV